MPNRPNLQTVAHAAGVSVATVSQVMRGTGRISETTRKKVLKAARKINYVPDGRAASMRSGEVREIGLLIHRIANPFNSEVISGVSDLLDSEGLLVSVLDSLDDANKQRRGLETLIRNRRGGLLWVPAIDTPQDTFDLLATHRIPTVTFLRRAKLADLDHVGIENVKATATATNYLADLGHKHIAYFGGRKEVDARLERIEGYKSVLAARGLEPPVVWLCEDSKRTALTAALALRDAHPNVTAIVCNGDMAALGASLAMAQLGLQPGKHMSIVGFDNVEDAALAIPPLTTMAVAPYELGKKLARVLLERIREPDRPTETVMLHAHLVVRQTTGAPVAT